MFNSEVTYRVGLAHLHDLRADAHDRRLAGLDRPDRDLSRSIRRRGRQDRTRVIATLSPDRSVRA